MLCMVMRYGLLFGWIMGLFIAVTLSLVAVICCNCRPLMLGLIVLYSGQTFVKAGVWF